MQEGTRGNIDKLLISLQDKIQLVGWGSDLESELYERCLRHSGSHVRDEQVNWESRKTRDQLRSEGEECKHFDGMGLAKIYFAKDKVPQEYSKTKEGFYDKFVLDTEEVRTLMGTGECSKSSIHENLLYGAVEGVALHKFVTGEFVNINETTQPTITRTLMANAQTERSDYDPGLVTSDEIYAVVDHRPSQIVNLMPKEMTFWKSRSSFAGKIQRETSGIGRHGISNGGRYAGQEKNVAM